MSVLAGIVLTIAAVGALINFAAATLTWRRFSGARPCWPHGKKGGLEARAPEGGETRASEGVALLKPLHGVSAALGDNLASLLEQDYPGPMRMLCGAARADDPAWAAVPDGPVERAVTGEPGCANRKVGNLMGLEARADEAVLVLSDADIRVSPSYLSAVMAALGQPGVGAVTCLYIGDGRGGRWARLAAMDIDYRFLPNAALGLATGLASPCFGSTIAMRRETLARIGGFAAFKDVLADDYEIGRAVRRLGLKIAIPPIVVTHLCGERSFGELIAHELRWARTIRRIDPAGHGGSLLTHAFALALIGGGLGAAAGLPLGLAIGLPAAVLTARLAGKALIDRATGANGGPWWLLPARDVLSFAIFLASFASDTVAWGGRRYRVRRGGVLSELQEPISQP